MIWLGVTLKSFMLATTALMCSTRSLSRRALVTRSMSVQYSSDRYSGLSISVSTTGNRSPSALYSGSSTNLPHAQPVQFSSPGLTWLERKSSQKYRAVARILFSTEAKETSRSPWPAGPTAGVGRVSWGGTASPFPTS